jgi:hypothetical protein
MIQIEKRLFEIADQFHVFIFRLFFARVDGEPYLLEFVDAFLLVLFIEPWISERVGGNENIANFGFGYFGEFFIVFEGAFEFGNDLVWDDGTGFHESVEFFFAHFEHVGDLHSFLWMFGELNLDVAIEFVPGNTADTVRFIQLRDFEELLDGANNASGNIDAADHHGEKGLVLDGNALLGEIGGSCECGDDDAGDGVTGVEIGVEGGGTRMHPSVAHGFIGPFGEDTFVFDGPLRVEV